MKKLFTTLLLVMLLSIFVLPVGVNAAEVDSEVSRTSTCTVNNITRSLTFENGEVYLKVGNQEPLFITFNCVDAGLDLYGSIWCVYSLDNGIRWWNYDFANANGNIDDSLSLYSIPRPTDDNPYGYVDDVESLVFDEKGLVIGYKILSGETYPILTLEEMTEQFLSKNPGASIPTLVPSDTPTSTSTPEPTVTPTVAPTVAPTATPTVAPTVVPTAVPTVAPTVEPTAAPTAEPTVAPKISIQKKSGYTALYVGKTAYSKYKLKNNVLTWKKGSKTLKFKGVKNAGYIKKSKNLVFMTKNGKVFTLSSKGKKKTIIKKGAKKLIKSGNFVAKVKTNAGTKNISSK